MTASLLNQPISLARGDAIPNRLAKSAMSEALATMDNRVTPELVRLYKRWGEGGTGLLITGNVMVDRGALGEPGNVVLEDDRDMALLSEWAQASTAHGAKVWMQLNHPGRQAPKGLNRETRAPSVVPFSKEMQAFFDAPRELTDAQIEDIIKRFANAAQLCKQAGFSGVQIHGAHGYLVSQFLSPLTNQRSDQWGGNAENRRRFVLRLLAAMRETTGPEFPIGIKLNSADFQKGGFTEEESLAVIEALADAGIDMIEISGGTYEAPAMAGLRPSSQVREAYFLAFAEKVRERVSTPLMVTGGFRSERGMSEALASGALEFIGLARPLAIEPDVSKRLLDGQDPLHQVRPIKTGIAMVDKAGLMEVSWYNRQLKRMGRGREPRPNESGLKAFFCAMAGNVSGTIKTRRVRVA